MKVRAFGVCLVLTLLVASSHMTVRSKAEAGDGDDVAIIVNPKNPQSDISFDMLRKFFKAERGEWPNGAKVVVAMLQPGHTERSVILRSVYGWDENYYQKYFGQGESHEAPRQLNSPDKMIQFVHYTPGAIGYVRADQVDSSKVNVLTVDGRKPGDAGYRIR
jgi:ABC-type phosphate transport system substrate-binding protein